MRSEGATSCIEGRNSGARPRPEQEHHVAVSGNRSRLLAGDPHLGDFGRHLKVNIGRCSPRARTAAAFDSKCTLVAFAPVPLSHGSHRGSVVEIGAGRSASSPTEGPALSVPHHSPEVIHRLAAVTPAKKPDHRMVIAMEVGVDDKAALSTGKPTRLLGNSALAHNVKSKFHLLFIRRAWAGHGRQRRHRCHAQAGEFGRHDEPTSDRAALR